MVSRPWRQPSKSLDSVGALEKMPTDDAGKPGASPGSIASFPRHGWATSRGEKALELSVGFKASIPTF